MNLFIEFPAVSTEEWEAAARADLKGRPIGKVLYRAEDVTVQAQPWPPRAWQIWAEVRDAAGAQRALARGAEGLVLEGATAPWTDEFHQVLMNFDAALQVPHDMPIGQQLAAVKGQKKPDIVLPAGPSYFEEIAKFRAVRRLCPGVQRLIARTSRWHATAYDPHVNLLRGTTAAMAAILGGCDALIVGLFTEARAEAGDFAERMALNTQLLLRDESYFGQVADPAAGSWYIESLTEQMVSGTYTDQTATAFVGVSRYPNDRETAPDAITEGRATTALELCRRRSEGAFTRPTARLRLGADEKLSRARAAFARDFLAAGGFAIVDGDAADLTILCDADAHYPVAREFPVLAAGPDFNRHSDQAALLNEWQNRLGI